MKRCKGRLFLLSAVVACLTACATAGVSEEKSPLGVTGMPPPSQALQPRGTPKQEASSPTPVAMFEGRPIATELPPEVKRLIDGVRRLHEQPGLILDRQAIYRALGVKVTESKSSRSTEGSREMVERLVFERPQEYPNWQVTLKYSEFTGTESWSVRVELSYGEGTNCYPSHLVERYWGKPFVYRAISIRSFLGELERKPVDIPPTGPQDTAPYDAGFTGATADAADVIFAVGFGGCLQSINANKLFKVKENRDVNIYHQ